MSEFYYQGVNIDAKALEEQNENLKKPKNDFQNQKKVSFDPKNYLDLKLKEHEATKMVKIRFLPISASDSTVFFNITTHALKVDKEIAKSGFKSYVCLNDEKVDSKEECPICKKSKELFDKSAKARQEGNSGEVIAYADKANLRLRRRYYHLIRKGKKKNVAVTAVARELACYVWGMMTDNIDVTAA